VGVKLGIYLNVRFSDVWFNRVIYGMLFVTAAQLIFGGNLLSMALAG
jgi:hypothetical protein